MRKIILLSIISLFFISSCVKDPYSGEIKLSNTAKYGAGGAIEEQ